jgi:hypothetical protein
VAVESDFNEVIKALMSPRDVSLLTAVSIVAELGDLRRFESAPHLMANFGLVPSEHSRVAGVALVKGSQRRPTATSDGCLSIWLGPSTFEHGN